MTFGDAIASPCGLRFMYDALELQSGASRKRLLGTEMPTGRNEIEASYRRLGEFYEAFTGNTSLAGSLRSKLAGLKDIGGTIERLTSGAVLDDIELFEVKTLALLAGEVGTILTATGIDDPFIPDLTEAKSLLDPDGLKVPTFYIYDSYSPELAALRARIRRSGDNTGALMAEVSKIEDKVRKELSALLKPYTARLAEALNNLAETDILLAKALQAKKMELSFPSISADGSTVYNGLWHPETASRLLAKGSSFQKIDVTFDLRPTVVVGANMGGKTITLKSVGLAQYLFQFGFGIPSRSASIDVKDSVKVCIGEEDMSAQGLSAFAAEIKRIDDILASARTGSRNLALIDEPARTTNPQEGTALVKSLLKQMSGLSTALIITTHYDIGRMAAHRLRVRGVVNGVMDYTLLETGDRGSVPHEALIVAESLGADKAWIETARRLIDKKPGLSKSRGTQLKERI